MGEKKLTQQKFYYLKNGQYEYIEYYNEKGKLDFSLQYQYAGKETHVYKTGSTGRVYFCTVLYNKDGQVTKEHYPSYSDTFLSHQHIQEGIEKTITYNYKDGLIYEIIINDGQYMALDEVFTYKQTNP